MATADRPGIRRDARGATVGRGHRLDVTRLLFLVPFLGEDEARDAAFAGVPQAG